MLIRRSRPSWRPFAALVFAQLAGCPSPMLHPLRASNGFSFNAALTAVAASGRHGNCYLGCRETSDALISPAFSIAAGFGHVFADRIGVQGGVYLPAFGNTQRFDAFGAIGTYSFLTLQNQRFSVGAGPELNITGASLTMGGEYRVPDLAIPFIPAVGVFARWFVPFERNPSPPTVPLSPTFELGIRGRFGPFFGQYAYLTDMEGRHMVANIVEGSFYAEGYHMFAIGVSFDGEYAEHRRARRQWVTGERGR